MPLPVLLSDVVEAIEPLSEEWHAYINRKTGEVVSFSEEQARLAEKDDADAPEWLARSLVDIREALRSEDYVRLPGEFDFDEYGVMQRFCQAFDEPEVRPELLAAISGRGAFRRFKHLIRDAGIEQRWYAYREQALTEFAAEFLKHEGIPFVVE